jgi:transcriptional regulator with XRE-family HTH domain
MPTGTEQNAAIQIQIGKRIRQLRVSMQWSLETLAEKADLDVSFLSGVERGLRNVSLRNLSRIASAFDLSLAELCELPKSRETGKRTMEARIIFLLRKQNAKTTRFILSFIESLDQWLSEGME